MRYYRRREKPLEVGGVLELDETMQGNPAIEYGVNERRDGKTAVNGVGVEGMVS